MAINKIPYIYFCPDCGERYKLVFLPTYDGLAVDVKNHKCHCQHKKFGLGFDVIINTKEAEIGQESLGYITTTSSGTLQPKWQKNNLRCPFCHEFQFFVNNGDSGQNAQCKNPQCPALGFDYRKIATQAYVTASGVVNRSISYFLQAYANSKYAKQMSLDNRN